jgi:3-methyl-2-oxobutanoate hydroxymethyltransferase
MMVKMEGGKWLVPIVNHLTEKGIPVCGHLGLTPQTIHKLGGFKMQAKNEKEAETLLNDAITLEQAGIQLLVLECIPDLLAYEISRTLKIPVIGIGAGNQTDGQVLVVYDLLGISTFIPKFAKNFLQEASGVKEAIVNYVESVRNRSFPK